MWKALVRVSYERSLLLCDAQQISLTASLRFALRRLRGGGASVYLVSGYFLPMAAWGSCWRMARMAVGAVNMEAAPYSDRTRKNAPGSGVPTGLPCTHKRHRSHENVLETAPSVDPASVHSCRRRRRRCFQAAKARLHGEGTGANSGAELRFDLQIKGAPAYLQRCFDPGPDLSSAAFKQVSESDGVASLILVKQENIKAHRLPTAPRRSESKRSGTVETNLIENGAVAVEQGGVADVGVAHHPAQV